MQGVVLIHLVLLAMLFEPSCSMDQGVIDTMIAHDASSLESVANRENRMSDLLQRAIMSVGYGSYRGGFPESTEVIEFDKRNWFNKQGIAEHKAFKSLSQMFPALVFSLGEGAVRLNDRGYVQNPSAVVVGAGTYEDCFYLVSQHFESLATAMTSQLVAQHYDMISIVLPKVIGYLRSSIKTRQGNKYPDQGHMRQLQAVRHLYTIATLFADIARVYGPFERRTVDRGSKLVSEGTTSKPSRASSSGSSSKYPCPNGKSTNGRCGTKYGNGMWCENACCSRRGWCGNSEEHCNPDMCEIENRHLSYY